MAGHIILDSCHNCGKHNTHLNVVDISECDLGDNVGNHIHVFVACDSCKRNIWDEKPQQKSIKNGD